MILDFRKCKSPEDVKRVFDKSKLEEVSQNLQKATKDRGKDNE